LRDGRPIFVQHDAAWEATLGREWWRYILEASLKDRHHAKQGRSIARWTIANARHKRTVFVKRYYHCSMWKSLLWRWLRRGNSEAWYEWHHLQQARQIGIPTPKPVAVAEVGNQAWLQSVLVVEELTDQVALHEAIPTAAAHFDSRDFRQWKEGLIDEVARLVRQLHGQSLFHRDLYLCHFFIPRQFQYDCPSHWINRVTLIDFHRLTRRRFFRLPARIKDLAQLEYSSYVVGINDDDRRRFWHRYNQGHKCRMLRFLTRFKSRLYRRRERVR
jgi:tRNA A-37 threonylcarbamoyl transferase component Bud32